MWPLCGPRRGERCPATLTCAGSFKKWSSPTLKPVASGPIGTWMTFTLASRRSSRLPASSSRKKRPSLRNKKVTTNLLPSDVPTEEGGTLFNNHNVLTATEVAKLKGVSKEAVYQALREGRLKGRKTNGTWLIKREDAIAWRTKKDEAGC